MSIMIFVSQDAAPFVHVVATPGNPVDKGGGVARRYQGLIPACQTGASG